MKFGKLVRKERYSWGRRKIIFFDRFEYNYISQIKRQYRDLIGSLEGLAQLVDVTKLKSAQGELRELQLELASFSYDIQKILREAGIHPFLIAGSLIGYLRHGGFIPWDDDIDFGLLRDEYEQLYSYLEQKAVHINEKKISCKDRRCLLKYLDFELKKSDGRVLFLRTQTHIKVLKGTSLVKSQAMDFFPLDFINENIDIEMYKKCSAKIWRKRRCGKSIKGSLDIIKSLSLNSGIFSEKKTSKVYYGFDNLDATKREHIRFFNTSDIFPLREANFEGYNFLIPNNPKEFLYTMLNSDFMSLPPDIGLSHHVIEFQEYNSSL